MVIQIDAGSSPGDIRRRRWAANLSTTLQAQNLPPKALQHRLAELGLTVSHQAIYQWLAGETSPSVDSQAVIARALGLPAAVLFPVEVAS